MKNVLISAVLIGMAALFVFSQTGNDRSVEAEIRRLNAQEVEALLRNDVKTESPPDKPVASIIKLTPVSLALALCLG